MEEVITRKGLTDAIASYARLAVRTGLHLQKGQRLLINAPIECASFARLVAREAYVAGAYDVHVAWADEKFSRVRFEGASDEALAGFPSWQREMYEQSAQEGSAFLSIHANDPEIMKGIPAEKLQIAQKSAGEALLTYRQKLMRNDNRWCVISVPTEGWARKVFPEARENAVHLLWEEILKSVRVVAGLDADAAWAAHLKRLEHAAKFMNEHAFHALAYHSEAGTNLTIALPEGHIWSGGAEVAGDGISFVANMPTEEIFTLPKRNGVEGTVVATRPLHYNGHLIEDFRLTFHQGKVASFHAERGEDVLRELLATDEGSSHLGEVALVPVDSPISRSGLLFYNTLFDENASCHLALGKAYPTSLQGGEKLQSLELLERGANDSLVHVDFMVGDDTLDIDGIMKDGSLVPVFRKGKYAF